MKESVRKNFFSVFGIPSSFHINEDELTRLYLNKQRDTHPDVSPLENEDSLLDSAYINLAYKILMDPITRAEHLLEMKGMSINLIYSTEFASEMFNIREKYDSMISEDDRKKFIVFLRARMSEIISSLYDLENDLQQFGNRVSLLRFISSFMEKVGTNVYSGN